MIFAGSGLLTGWMRGSSPRMTAGKLTLDGGMMICGRVQSLCQKYFPSRFGQIKSINTAIPHPKRGASRIVTNVGRGMRWTRACHPTNDTNADGEVVWF
jgi:hypothetical protein